jgi:hypothetical protein
MGAACTRPSLRPHHHERARADCITRARGVAGMMRRVPGCLIGKDTNAHDCALAPCGRGHRRCLRHTGLGEGSASTISCAERDPSPACDAAHLRHPLPQGERVHRICGSSFGHKRRRRYLIPLEKKDRVFSLLTSPSPLRSRPMRRRPCCHPVHRLAPYRAGRRRPCRRALPRPRGPDRPR